MKLKIRNQMLKCMKRILIFVAVMLLGIVLLYDQLYGIECNYTAYETVTNMDDQRAICKTTWAYVIYYCNDYKESEKIYFMFVMRSEGSLSFPAIKSSSPVELEAKLHQHLIDIFSLTNTSYSSSPSSLAMNPFRLYLDHSTGECHHYSCHEFDMASFEGLQQQFVESLNQSHRYRAMGGRLPALGYNRLALPNNPSSISGRHLLRDRVLIANNLQALLDFIVSRQLLAKQAQLNNICIFT